MEKRWPKETWIQPVSASEWYQHPSKQETDQVFQEGSYEMAYRKALRMAKKQHLEL